MGPSQPNTHSPLAQPTLLTPHPISSLLSPQTSLKTLRRHCHPPPSTMASRRLRAFKRWMTANSIHWSDALDLIDTDHVTGHATDHGGGSGGGICVKSKCELKEGDLVATIPKKACLTVKTSGAAAMIEAAELEGSLALSVAVMYERSLRSDSPWAGYLQLLPYSEPLPLVWTLDEVDCFLRGTELHKTVKEDKTVIYEDWKECILPLIHSDEFAVDPNYFGVEDYFAAKSLVASRSFQIDDYHGYGMVPLADLFNHKTGAEDVHFTLPDESDDGEESTTDEEDDQSDEPETQAPQLQENGSSATVNGKRIPNDPDSAYSVDTPDNPMVLEMILVKDVKAGAEVFNTYGIMGNAALLHRYGFTELDNEYDIVNIDLDLVLQWSSSLFSGRHSRSRLSFWRKLGYSGCVSENSEYFEISFDGEPQLELSILLYIILLPEKEFTTLDLTVVTGGNSAESTIADLSKKSKRFQGQIAEMSRDMLLTKSVRKALISLADMRESLYGTTSLQEDVVSLKKCNCITERKLYYSLALRVSERRILKKLRTYAESGCKSLKGATSKKLKY